MATNPLGFKSRTPFKATTTLPMLPEIVGTVMEEFAAPPASGAMVLKFANNGCGGAETLTTMGAELLVMPSETATVTVALPAVVVVGMMLKGRAAGGVVPKFTPPGATTPLSEELALSTRVLGSG